MLPRGTRTARRGYLADTVRTNLIEATSDEEDIWSFLLLVFLHPGCLEELSKVMQKLICQYKMHYELICTKLNIYCIANT